MGAMHLVLLYCERHCYIDALYQDPGFSEERRLKGFASLRYITFVTEARRFEYF